MKSVKIQNKKDLDFYSVLDVQVKELKKSEKVKIVLFFEKHVKCLEICNSVIIVYYIV